MEAPAAQAEEVRAALAEVEGVPQEAARREAGRARQVARTGFHRGRGRR